jgi:hypothetical protein
MMMAVLEMAGTNPQNLQDLSPSVVEVKAGNNNAIAAPLKYLFHTDDDSNIVGLLDHKALLAHLLRPIMI